MQEKIEAFKQHVIIESANPDFLHHKWFVKWHLEVVQKIACELCDRHPEADRDMVELMVWLHDYGKILDFDNEYAKTLVAGPEKLHELGLPPEFIETAVKFVDMTDKKLEIDLRQAPLEVKIISTADGCSHLAGPFLKIFWHEGTDKTFTNKTLEELMAENLRKAKVDWQYKIVLPEARAAFEERFKFICEQSGELPTNFL
jgi:hypothetical protein